MNEITYPPGCKDIQSELANDELIRRLKKIQQSFQDLKQDSPEKYKELAIYLGSDVFLEHEHEDVKLLVACCIADVFRIYAPDSPYQDPSNLKKIFLFLSNQLKGLKDYSNTTFKRYHYLLENLESVNTFLLCQELEDSQEIIADVFETVFKIINDKTPVKVKTLLSSLLLPLLNESDQLSTRVLDTLFARIIEPQKSNNKEAYNLAVNLIKKGNEHFEYLVQNHLNNILLTSRGNLSIAKHHQSSNTSLNASMSSEDSFNLDKQNTSGIHGTSSQFISDKLCLIIYELNTIRYALLELVLPQLEYKLKSNDLKERREYTKLLSKMFSEKESTLAQKLPNLWEAYLERFADANDDIRKICIQHIYDFLIQQSSHIKSIASTTSINVSASVSNTTTTGSSLSSSVILDQIIEIVKNRSLDSEEALRYEVVQEILKAIKQDSNLITIELLNVLKDRTLDVKIKVRKLALQGLAALYKKIHSKLNNSRQTVQVINWIPTKIMRIYFQESIEDKLLVERLLNSSIVPYSLGAKEKMAQLYYSFTTFDEYSILSLIEIMKNRVHLNQVMKSIIDNIESSSKSEALEQKLNNEIILVSQQLLDATKGHEFMNTFINFLKTNNNVRTYFKNLVNVNQSCSKSMQFIQLILNNLNSLNQTNTGMAKRLIERMSSIIIDKECIEKLIELVEYKVKQKLTLKQRKLLNKRKKKAESQSSNSKSKSRSKTKKTFKQKDSDQSDYDENNDDYEDEDDEDFDDLNDDDETIDNLDLNEEEDGEDDDAATKTTENSRDDVQNDRLLVRHIDDDGEKGIKLLNLILFIHNMFGFNNSTTYKKLFTFINSRKDNVISSTLKLLSTYYTINSRLNAVKEENDLFNKINNDNLEKLKNLCKIGKAKQAKYAIHLIYNNFEKPKNEEILHELYKDVIEEAAKKQSKTFITCLASLGHICLLIPKLVGKDIKEFLSKSIVKEILMQPATTQLNISHNESSSTLAAKRKNNLKLAGKWCENEDELPFSTRARIQSIKLVTRWCLGLKSECSTIMITLKILIKILKEYSDSTNQTQQQQNSDDSMEDCNIKLTISEAERSRIRSVCGSQLLKLAQEPCFKNLITPEYFHILAKLIIDPVNNVRDIMIKKLNKPLKSNKLNSYYMAIFALSGLDTNKDRKLRVKKIYTSLIKQYRQIDVKENNKTSRILPEMCLAYAVSLLAHNIKIDSLKNDHKVKQVKECMSLILDPLLENPDGYQIAYIKKVLNKIKTCDDGLAAHAVNQSVQTENHSLNKVALQNLYMFNKSLVFICEIFLFHMHSKSSSYLSTKEAQFDIKLPLGFYATRENGNNNEQQQQELNKELEEHFNKKENAVNKSNEENNDKQSEKSDQDEKLAETNVTVSKSSTSRIEIIPINRKRKVNEEQKQKETNKNNKIESDAEDDEDMVLSDIVKAKKNESSNDLTKNSNNDVSIVSRPASISPGPPASKKRLTDTNTNKEKLNKRNDELSNEANEIEKEEMKTTRSRRNVKNNISTSPKENLNQTGTRKSRRVAKKSNENNTEEEKENEKEEFENENVEENIEEDKRQNENDESKEDEEDVVVEKEKKTARSSTRGIKKLPDETKQPSAKKSITNKKDLEKTVTESPSYSLRQKRATTSAKK